MRQSKKNHTSKKPAAVLAPFSESKDVNFPIVAIGASAGGLEAMNELLKNLAPDTGMAFLYVQHLSPDHKSMLSSLLANATSMKVQEAGNKEKVLPNHIYVMPPDKEMHIVDGKIKITPRPPTPRVSLPVDILFSSLAETHKENVIGVILSGSATDGTRGMKAIKHEGGLTFAQDDTAKFASMPLSAIGAGVVDFVLSPKKIAQEITRLSKHPYIRSNGTKANQEKEIDNNNPDLKIILTLLHKTQGVDFSQYKMTTIKRRIARRMLLYKIKSLKEYATLLKEKEDEVNILYQDLLINVTAFFRDTEAHQYLKTTLLPKLLKSKKPDEPLRIWVAACATGEEAYSLAIALLEIQSSRFTNIPVQIFATDLDAEAIAKARIAEYSQSDLAEVSPKRLQRFYTKSQNGFRLTKSVRDMCVFAPHNILSDPPFAHVDFISCCNLLIYFDNAAQKKAIATFHYALNDTGFLMLGKAETVGQSAQLFSTVHKKFKIFARKNYSGTRPLPALTPRFSQQLQGPVNRFTVRKPIRSSSYSAGLDKAIDAVMLSRYMPASVIITMQLEILQFRGATDSYISPSTGRASLNILKMTRPEIAFELRSAISKVIKSKQSVRKTGIEVKLNDLMRSISIEVVPLKIEWDEPLLLVLFNEQQPTEIFHEGKKTSMSNSVAKDRRIKKLEGELAAVRADMLALSQEQEAFNEELQSANEEVVSSNEELQTINEELETSKEEIESTNEELTTTNQELQTRNELLNESYDYAEAVTTTIHEAMIVLDKDLRVKSANKSFYRQFATREEETEGVLLYDLGNGQWNIPKLRELLEDIIPKNTYFHSFEVEQASPGIGKRVMLLNASRINQKAHREQLILLSIADMTEMVIAKKRVEESEKRYKDLIYGLPVGVYTCSPEGEIELYNETAVHLWGRTPERGKDKWCGAWKMYNSDGTFLPHDQCPMAIAFKKGPSVSREIIIERPDGIKHTVLPNPQLIYDSDGKITGAINTVIDVTPQVIARKEIEEREKQFHFIADSMPQKVWTADAAGNRTYFNKRWLDYSGMSLEELQNEGWKKIIHPDDLQRTELHWQQALKTGGDFEVEDRKRDKHGGYKWHLSRAFPFKDETGKIKMWIGTNTEVEKQKMQSLKFENAVKHRTQELREANLSLEEKNTELQKMNNELESFNFISSHDLQEPLRKMQTLASRLLEKESQNLSDSGKDYFLRMREAAKRMQALIQDLLGFSHLSTAERKYELIDLRKFVEDVKAEFSEAIMEKNATIEIGEMSEVKIIPFQFHQLMQNLMGNALKFSKKDIPLHVKIASEMVKGDSEKVLAIDGLSPTTTYCHITFSDNGIGFEQHFSERIFQLFQKLHRKDQYPGTGIGLAIVKKIVENHNGVITVSSELDKGARFDIYIPN